VLLEPARTEIRMEYLFFVVGIFVEVFEIRPSLGTFYRFDIRFRVR